MSYKKFLIAFLALFLIGSGLSFAGENEGNAAIMKKFYNEVANMGNMAMIDELISDSFMEHEQVPGGAQGKDAVKGWFTMLHSGMPDVKFTIIDMVAHGDKVWTYYKMTGTQSGEFMGMPASGKKIEVNGVDIVQFKDGKAIAHWGVSQDLQMMQQLGMIPMPGQSSQK